MNDLELIFSMLGEASTTEIAKNKDTKGFIENKTAAKKGGIIALFVPNGYSDDPAFRTEITHTLFLVPDMIKEFFDYSGAFTDVAVENFRPNFDFFISAVKK